MGSVRGTGQGRPRTPSVHHPTPQALAEAAGVALAVSLMTPHPHTQSAFIEHPPPPVLSPPKNTFPRGLGQPTHTMSSSTPKPEPTLGSTDRQIYWALMANVPTLWPPKTFKTTTTTMSP